LASLKHFLADEWEKSRAQKRGGGASILSLDIDSAEKNYQTQVAEELSPEKLFERRWTTTLLNSALARLEAEYAAAAKKERFDQLQLFLSGDRQDITYAEMAKRLGMTEGAVKVAVMRLRQRFRNLVRAEIAHTVASEAEVDEEMRCLFTALNS